MQQANLNRITIFLFFPVKKAKEKLLSNFRKNLTEKKQITRNFLWNVKTLLEVEILEILKV